MTEVIPVSVPLGELYFLMQRSRSGGWESTVSVPSRGAIFLNLNKANMAEETKKTVSVPLGELYFLMEFVNIFSLNRVAGFRPLSGSYIS